MRALALIAAAVLLFGATESRAAPAPHIATAHRPHLGPWHRVAGLGITATDGVRYAVGPLADGETRLYDTAKASHVDLPTPTCASPGVTLDYVGPVRRYVGGGHVVWQCSTFPPQHQLIWIYDIATGRFFLAPGLMQLWADEVNIDAEPFVVTSVGRHWLYGVAGGTHVHFEILTSLDQPQIILRPAQQDGHITVDPDTVTGTRRLCRGIVRPAGDPDARDLPFFPVQYDRPYAVLTDYHLDPTGSAPDRILDCQGAPTPPRGPVANAQLGGGLLTWSHDQGHRVNIQSTTTGARVSRRAPGPNVEALEHTRHAVYITSGGRQYVAALHP
jgi:hypothetical protein